MIVAILILISGDNGLIMDTSNGVNFRLVTRGDPVGLTLLFYFVILVFFIFMFKCCSY